MSKGLFKKLLIANRGEIAVRIIRAARELGIKTVAVFSEADCGALHVRLADEKVALGGVRAADTYLNVEKLINAAISTDSDAVHPGYGFLSENSGFAAAVKKAGLIFVGPSPEVMAMMGDKGEARAKALELDIPLIPGTVPGLSVDKLKAFASKAGYPVIFKAAAGGSGRGMRIVRSEDELEEKMNEASAEALAAFSNGQVFLEKFLETPRHIEVQVFGDSHGNVIHLFERECSVQRRHQKLIEEAPALRLHADVRRRLHEAAVKLAKAVRYENSGTVEFLVEGGEKADSPFYFLEMNTRIQVEHPVTEQVTGIDLLKLQLKVASGAPLGISQEQVTTNGHATEFRVYAEIPAKNFAPTSGEIRYLSRPGGPGIREDGWVEAGTKVSPYYDALLCKLIITASSREEAVNRARAALDELVLEGVDSTVEFHRWALTQKAYIEGMVDVYWVSRNYHGEQSPRRRGVALWFCLQPIHMNQLKVETGGVRLDLFLHQQLPEHSRKFFQELCKSGKVKVNGKKGSSGQILKAGDLVEIYSTLTPITARADIGRSIPPLEVAYEDEHLLIVIKPRGMASVTLRADDEVTVADCLASLRPETFTASEDPRESGLVHRLDNYTSGLLIAAKSNVSWKALRDLLMRNGIHKSYSALVEGVMREKHCEVSIGLVQSGKVVRASEDEGAWPARSVVRRGPIVRGKYSAVSVEVARAYRHQVRAHLALKGHPIIGDIDYGSKTKLGEFFSGETGFLLHAESIEFRHPMTEERIAVENRCRLLTKLTYDEKQ